MKIDRRRFLGALVVGSAGLVSARPAGSAGFIANGPLDSSQTGRGTAFAMARVAAPPPLLARAQMSLDAHAAMIPNRDVIGLVDFSMPSGVPRFQLVDLGNGRVISTHLVAHGRGSDPGNTGSVQSFSNRLGSNASCRGSFLTGDSYFGRHGRSRRLIGLEAENSNAASRAIVIHSADYVSEEMAGANGRIGRSQGCFTVTENEVGELLSRLGSGRLLFAWK